MSALKWRGLILVVLTALLTACGDREVAVRTLAGYSMGTSYSVKLVSTVAQAQHLDAVVRSRLETVDQAMSTYLPRSDVSRFNDAAVNDWVDVSPLTVEVVSLALDVARLSDGAFDPTIAPLVDAWGFGPQPRPDQIPSQPQIDDLLKQVGWAAIEIDDAHHRLRKTAERELDLSGIAKGFAVDQVADALANEGIVDYLVEVGGELRFSGTKPGDEPWRVGIETPDSGARSAYRILEVGTGAMATSGDYRNYYEEDGVRYSHTLDPSNGRPIHHSLVSVSVLADDCALSDAFATAMLVKGYDEAQTLAESQGLAVMLIERDGDGFTAWQSERFAELFGSAN
ncbi:FAD:protein FMN transferase [Saccharospirillum mangrovi]|uniref:FAD:protein FMN transferase n=1 Tax=Saccharospirillum mangrovi TaxID=2161747 RepID=UPI000D361F36|nr:FAD:protein FMN transferase [Saccharospirillum mangrovi]